jgi:MFS family permease
MSVVTAPLRSAAPSPSSPSLRGLDGLNFFVAAMSAGFGPYLAVYLADQKWTQQEIGFVLTASGLAALLSQLPGGELVDAARSKRALVGVGSLLVTMSAFTIDLRPTLGFVFGGLVLQGVTGGFVGPAIVAISLGLVGHSGLAERLGRNQRFASMGSLTAAGLMGLVAHLLSYRAIFAVVAALAVPIFVMLARIRPAEIHFGRSCGAPHHDTPHRPARAGRRILWKTPGLLGFATSLLLFQLANASILPLVGEDLVYQRENYSSLIVALMIVLPQIIVAVMAPWIGQHAQDWGRRPLLLIGFGTLPVRALLLAFITDPRLLVGLQLLDGVSGAVVGVLTALVVADLTNGTGRFNLAQGIVGTASGLGASLGTTVFGVLAANWGRTIAFLGITSVALLAVSFVWILQPETRPSAST